MRNLLLGLAILTLATSCTGSKSGKRKPQLRLLSITETDVTEENGKPLYNIILSDSTGLDYMYMDEINKGLLTGKWEYNKNVHMALD